MYNNTTQRVKWILVLIFVLPFWGFAQTGPGGVGTTDGTSTLELWLSPEEGALVHSQKIENSQDDLKITELQPGVYFFRALQGNGFVSVQRVVIQ